MDHTIFQSRLHSAAHQALEVAREMVKQALPDAITFLVAPNQSFDGNPRQGDEMIFPEESLADRTCHGPWSAEQVVAFLWRDGKVPEWIDAFVHSETGGHTLIKLVCCGRYTAQEDLLYHRAGGMPPFLIESLPLPPRWETVETSGKFDLYWQKHR